MKPKQKTPLATIFFTVFLDMLGLSVIIPVIPALFFDPDTQFFAAEVSSDVRSVMYGFIIAIFPLMQFFGAPILGAYSDRFGRRPMLQWSLVGALIGYLLFAYAISIQNIYLLFAARAIPGFMGGNISIIQSAIADVSLPKDKAKNFGLVGAAFGFGFIIGPLIGGVLADNTFVSWFTHSTPFYFTAALTFLNLILINFFFPETLKDKSTTKVNAFSGLNNVAKALKDSQLRRMFAVVLLLSLGFTFFTQFFSVLLIEKFSFSESNIGLLYGWIGIWLVLTQAILVRRFSGRIPSAQILKYSLLVLSATLFLVLLPNQPFWFYMINPLIAIAQGLTSPNLVTVVSSQVASKQQGEILGINQSMNAVGQIFPPMIGGFLNTFGNFLPILVGACCVFCAWLIFQFVVPNSIKNKEL